MGLDLSRLAGPQLRHGVGIVDSSGKHQLQKLADGQCKPFLLYNKIVILEKYTSSIFEFQSISILKLVFFSRNKIIPKNQKHEQHPPRNNFMIYKMGPPNYYKWFYR